MIDQKPVEPDWPAIAAHVRQDIFRHHLSEREMVILDVLLRLSFDLGRAAAKVPRLEDFFACTGISKGNALGTLQRLVDKRILMAEAGAYRLLPRTADHHWSVSPRMNLGAAEKALLLLRALQSENQPELLPRDPTLRDALAEQAVAQAAAGVPESGTQKFPNQESRSRIGNLLAALSTTLDVRHVDQRNVDVSDAGRTTTNDQLQERVRAFVGEPDWARYWSRAEYDHLWTDAHCRDALEKALSDCRTRIKDKIPVKKTRGAMLWNQFGTERQMKGV